MPNLRIWLTRFSKKEGYILPAYWLTPTKTAENRLNELPRHIRRKLAVGGAITGAVIRLGRIILKW